MQIKQNILAVAVIGAAVLIAILSVALIAIPSGIDNGALQDNESGVLTEEGIEAPVVTPKITPAQTKPPVIAPAQPSDSGIYVISPSAGDKLVLGQNHEIKWSAESGFKGYVYLADASTKEIVGWINSETGPRQTSYAWDTQNLFISRYSPNKKTVGAGNYVIGVGFESKQTPAVSNAFEIIYPSQVTIDEHNIAIKDFYATPNSLTVKKGSKLIFTNNDNATLKIAVGSISFSIAPSVSYIFDTSALFPGEYNFYAENYSTLRVTVNVR